MLVDWILNNKDQYVLVDQCLLCKNDIKVKFVGNSILERDFAGNCNVCKTTQFYHQNENEKICLSTLQLMNDCKDYCIQVNPYRTIIFNMKMLDEDEYIIGEIDITLEDVKKNPDKLKQKINLLMSFS